MAVLEVALPGKGQMAYLGEGFALGDWGIGETMQTNWQKELH